MGFEPTTAWTTTRGLPVVGPAWSQQAVSIER
jgi:hypothetical protein